MPHSKFWLHVSRGTFLAFLPTLSYAQSIGCFQSLTYNGQYSGIPTQSQYVNQISFASANAVVTQTVPTPLFKDGSQIGVIVCPTANGNYNLSFCSSGGCATTGTTATSGTIVNGKAYNFTPSCVQLTPISGSMPNLVSAYVDSASTVIKLPYWLNKPCP